MRLWPTDPAWRGRTHRLDDRDSSAVTNALRVGDVVRGRMTQVFTANRECSVDLGVVTAIAEWSGDAPAVRQERQVLVKTVLDTTRRVLIDLA
jgi:exosome complex RNA-binding protein Csl4